MAPARRFEQREGANHVGSDELAGRRDRPVDVRLRREVDDDVRAPDQRRRDDGVADVAAHERVARVVHHVAQRLDAARVGQLVERRDAPVAMRGERMAHEVAADEPGAAGHQNLGHDLVPWSVPRAGRGAARSAKGAEEIRERADAGQRHREVEPAVLRHRGAC